MKNLKIVGLVIVGLLIVGCNGENYEFVQPGKTISERDKAEKICKYDARKSMAYMKIGINKDLKIGAMVNQCMDIEGYTQQKKGK